MNAGELMWLTLKRHLPEVDQYEHPDRCDVYLVLEKDEHIRQPIGIGVEVADLSRPALERRTRPFGKADLRREGPSVEDVAHREEPEAAMRSSIAREQPRGSAPTTRPWRQTLSRLTEPTSSVST